MILHVAPPSVDFAELSCPPMYTVFRVESFGSMSTIWL
jgi:hypothetical protein